MNPSLPCYFIRLSMVIACWFSITSLCHAREASASCVEIKRSSNSSDGYEITNRCSGDASVAYCSINKKIWGKACGESGSKFNPYYTHMMNLKPGEKANRSGSGEMRFAACLGYINAWEGIKGKFHSSNDGSFECWPKSEAATLESNKAANPEGKPQMAVSTAFAANLAEACSHAQEPLISTGISAPLCNCKPAGNSGRAAQVYRCEVQYAVPDETPDILIALKAWIRKQVPGCDASQDKNCQRSRTVSVGGIRG